MSGNVTYLVSMPLLVFLWVNAYFRNAARDVYGDPGPPLRIGKGSCFCCYEPGEAADFVFVQFVLDVTEQLPPTLGHATVHVQSIVNRFARRLEIDGRLRS